MIRQQRFRLVYGGCGKPWFAGGDQAWRDLCGRVGEVEGLAADVGNAISFRAGSSGLRAAGDVRAEGHAGIDSIQNSRNDSATCAKDSCSVTAAWLRWARGCVG